MSIWAVIPVKPLNRAKSRLAEVLSPDQRYRFAEAMYRRVLQVAVNARQITGTLVISRDTKVLAMAREVGAKTIQESSSSDLNPALERATEVVRLWRAGALLILPADLPFLTAVDVEEMAKLGMDGPCVVLAGDGVGDGTNAMLLRPPGLITYQYGPDSYARHRRAALRAGFDVRTYDSERLQLDIDLPEDLYKYNHLIQQGHFDNLPLFLPDTAT